VGYKQVQDRKKIKDFVHPFLKFLTASPVCNALYKDATRKMDEY
jgi:hypothetical protein